MIDNNIFGLILVIVFVLVLGVFVFITIRSSIRSRNYKRKLLTITDDVETLRKAVGYDEEKVKKLSPTKTNDKCQVLPSGEVVCSHCGFINDKHAKKCICCSDKLDV